MSTDIAKTGGALAIRPDQTNWTPDQAAVQFGDARLPERFWEKVRIVESGCWEWTKARNEDGYGRYGAGGRGRAMGAHRAAHEALVGPIPEGMQVLHGCDNPPCVNPAHLGVGTNAANVRDRENRQRNGYANRASCPKGHPYDDANTYERPDRPGNRDCRTCRREAHRRWKARNISAKSIETTS